MLFQAKKTPKMAYDVIKWHLVTSVTKKYFRTIILPKFFCVPMTLNDILCHFSPFFVKKAQKMALNGIIGHLVTSLPFFHVAWNRQ